MVYRYITTSVAGFVQQLAVAYINHGYVFYVAGHIPPGSDAEAIDRWQIGARYLALSTVPLLAVAWRRREHPEDRLLRWSGLGTLGGACLFAATLWLMALTGQRWLGAITPLGGLGMLSGWLLLGLHAWRSCGARPDGTGTGSSSG